MQTNEGIKPDEAMDVVSRRADVLELMLEEPAFNRDLRSGLGVSRSTAYKALRELEELQLIARGENGYEPTLLGRLLFEEYRRFQSTVEDIGCLGTLLSCLSKETDLPPGVFAGANVYFADRHAPNRPVHMIEETVRSASVLKGTGPVVLPSYVELFHELIVEERLEAEFVFEQPVLDHLVTDYDDRITEAFETGDLRVRQFDGELPFALLVAEGPNQQVGIVVYDRGGELRGYITNDSDYAIDWASRVWSRYVDESRRVTSIANGEYDVESPERQEG